jgi:predicted HNH restriction endonuclease
MFTNENPPTAADYLNAISDLKNVFNDAQTKILVTQYSRPGRAVTSQQLRDALGYTGIAASNLAYGTLGKLVAERLMFSVADRSVNRPGWWRVLSTGDGAGDHFTWIMRPQLASALEHVGIVDSRDDGVIDAPDIDFARGIEEIAIEGRRQLVTHLRRERNRGIVEMKKASAASLVCELCGFDSASFYGVAYCEAHHLTPLASLADGAETTIRDLALVCANCHRIIHSRFPPLTLDEVAGMIKQQQAEQAGGRPTDNRTAVGPEGYGKHKPTLEASPPVRHRRRRRSAGE